MNLNELLLGKGIDPQQVLVFRHRPHEPKLNKVLPWLAAERPDLFNAYQSTQKERVERAMTCATHVAAFIGLEPGKALFVGLYSVKGSKPISRKHFWAISANRELKALGMNGFTAEDPRSSCLLFDLALTRIYAHWKGKLVVGWPPPELAYWRWAQRNEFSIHAIHEESTLVADVREWDAIDWSWEELSVLPSRWWSKLEEWRVIYYIFDSSDGKGYVGSACGKGNLRGRWRNYATSGHGGNRLLRKRDPKHFRFTILERVSPDMPKDGVERLEGSWKVRLHTRAPNGLNDN